MPRAAPARPTTASRRALDPVLPAVTCSVQSTLPHRAHADRARDRRQRLVLPRPRRGASSGASTTALVQGEKVWETARRAKPGFRVANVCWWYAMGATTDLTVTPRPIYHADGRKAPDCYTDPPELHDRLTGAARRVPAVHVLGPERRASRRRAGSRRRPRRLLDAEQLDLLLVYLPHLDYDHQRFGPEAPEAAGAAAELDEVARRPGRARARARRPGRRAVRVRDHAGARARWTSTARCAAPGCCDVYTQAGMEYLDPWTSRAFAVADHQIAHVYVRDPADLPARARGARRAARASDQVLEGERIETPPASDTSAPGELVARGRARRVVHVLLLARRRARARTSRAPSRSTASPATTPPSCSWTRTTAGQGPGRRGARCARRRACAT